MTRKNISVDEVKQWLREFRDPETGRDIVTSGQLKELQVEGDRVEVAVAFTSFVAILRERLKEQLTKLLEAKLAGRGLNVNVRLIPLEREPTPIGEVGVRARAVVLVGSGKGGVGKSTVAALLAFGLSKAGSTVGLLDADVYGPSIAHLLGCQEQPRLVEGLIQPANVESVKVLSMGLLVPKEEAVIWRGPMLHKALTQFLHDTNWGTLDYLIIDMPPGTGDASISLSQLLPGAYAVVVCTPQDVALLDATKAVTMFRRVNIEVLGIVENMSYFVCPNCSTRHEIFGHGGARRQAQELGIPFLGEIPINAQIRVRGDEGKLANSFEDDDCRPFFDEVCFNLVEQISRLRRQNPQLPSLNVINP